MIRKGTARVRLTALPKSAADAVNTTVADAGYFVQAGAFSSRDKAEAIKTQIPKKYAPIARIMPKTGSDGTLHRLIVGPFPDRAKAAKAARQINTFARTPTRIIRQP
jgi:cell division septation protein DedD